MKIIFQGDSVTDGGRDMRNFHDMGKGYPLYASKFLSEGFPDTEFEFINLGISGTRTGQLADRLYADAIKLNPDIISILIGINDIWHRYESQRIETSDEQIEANYRAILTRLRKQTNAKIVIIAPYILDCDDKEQMRKDLVSVLSIIKKLAEEFADVYIPLNQLFEEALKTQLHPQYYSKDGVHPNDEGAAFIGKQYFDSVAPLIKQMI